MSTKPQASAVVLFLGLLGCGTVCAQSLADISKKTEEERAKASQDQQKNGDAKNADKPSNTKAYSDKDLKPVPASAASDTKSEPEAKPAAEKIDKANEEKPSEGKTARGSAKDQAYWRGRVAPLHRRIADKLATLESMERRIRELTSELNSVHLNARRAAGLETERQRLMSDADVIRASVKADKAEVDAIEEEGRRAGALPGWFR
jgi:hypothetical protein